MFFRKKKDIEKHARRIDKLVTGLIIWGAVASMIGLWKTEKWREIERTIWKQGTKIVKKWYNIFGKVLVGIISTFSKK